MSKAAWQAPVRTLGPTPFWATLRPAPIMPEAAPSNGVVEDVGERLGCLLQSLQREELCQDWCSRILSWVVSPCILDISVCDIDNEDHPTCELLRVLLTLRDLQFNEGQEVSLGKLRAIVVVSFGQALRFLDFA